MLQATGYPAVACEASVSSRGSSRKLGQERKKNEWQGRGKKEPHARKPHDFEKLRSHKNAASDWRGAGSVDYLAFETSIKPGIARYLAFADLSNIFLIQSLLYFQRSPVTRHRRVTYVM